MVTKRYCKHYRDDATCEFGHKGCAGCGSYCNEYVLTDCKNYNPNISPPRERCRYLIDPNSADVPCAMPRFTKSGKRIICTFYEKGDE